jgi:hypothetical protein
MNRGVEILIARMKSNPEEFKPDNYSVGGHSASRWEGILHNWRHCLTEEELKAFQDALKETHRELFSQEVMKHILRKGEAELTEMIIDEYQHPYNTQAIGIVNPVKATWGASTNTGHINVGQQTLDEETIRFMKAEMAKIRAQEV